MVLITVLPVLLVLLGSGFEWALTFAFGVLTSPVLISGLLYLWTARIVDDAPAPLSELAAGQPAAADAVVSSRRGRRRLRRRRSWCW